MADFDPDAYLKEKTGAAFDPDKYLAEKAGAPAAPRVSTKPAAPFIPETPPSFGEVIRGLGRDVAQAGTDLYHEARAANDAATRVLFHPGQALANPAAVARESLRGINDNIPFGNGLVQAIGGPPAVSPEDAAAAPGFRALGGVAGLPAGGMVGEIGGTLLGKGLRAGREFVSNAAARQEGRALETLEHKATKVQRGKLRTDVVEQAVADNPELRKAAAAGDDAKVSAITKQMREEASAALEPIYKASAPKALDAGAEAVTRMDARIAELQASPEASQRAAAKALKSVRDEFNASFGTADVDMRSLRAAQSDYQKTGYGKALPGDEAASARIAASQEASKAVGDALLKQVTGLDYAAAKAAAKLDPEGVAAKILKANDTITAAGRIEATVAQRAGAAKPKKGISAMDVAMHAPAAAAAAMHNPMAAIPLALAPHAPALGRFAMRQGDELLARTFAAAQQGNPWAAKQIAQLATTPVGAARLAAIKAGRTVQASVPRLVPQGAQ